jgi:hypothetical protein
MRYAGRMIGGGDACELGSCRLRTLGQHRWPASDSSSASHKVRLCIERANIALIQERERALAR